MFSKCLYQVLIKIFDFLIRIFYNMTDQNSESDNNSNQTRNSYKFKPFCYEKVKVRKGSKVPHARSGHRIGADSANFYSFGGYNPLIEDIENDELFINTYPLFQELWKFNFARKEWTRYPNSHTLPLELASNALVLYKNVLLVYGGTGSPFGVHCSNQLFSCRVNEKEGLMQEIQTTGQLPLPAYGQAVIYHNDYLYTIGGTTGTSYTCDIHRLNFKTLVWEAVYICTGSRDFEPAGRYRHEIGFDNENIYILGGGTSVLAFDLERIPVFNLKKRTWHSKATLKDRQIGVPGPRRCHGAVQIQTEMGIQVFIAGGHDDDNVYDDLWRLDLTTFQWTFFEKCRLPYPIYFHGAAATPEGRLYIFGGIRSEQNEIIGRSDTIYSSWLCIPKLSEMCWEAVLQYSPHIVNCASDDLINIGIPRQFVQRLGNKSDA